MNNQTMTTATGEAAPEARANPSAPEGEGAAREAASALSEWTIMLYMAGDNNLTDDSIRALTMLKRVGTADRIHVVAQIDPRDPRMPSRRLDINRLHKSNAAARGLAQAGREASVLAEDSLSNLAGGRVRLRDEPAQPRQTDFETDTADPETLFDFISWTKDNRPGKRYMLVLCGHSAGVEEGFLLKDDNPPRAMSFDDLVMVLRAVQERLGIRLDILGMDACLMNMAEICYQLKKGLHGDGAGRGEAAAPLAEFVVGSQGFVPNPGWPYAQIVERLNAAVEKAARSGGEVDSEQFARLIVNQYTNFYVENAAVGGLSVDQSVLRVADAEGLTGAVRYLTSVLKPRLDEREFRNAILLAHWASQSYNGELFVDLSDFCGLLQEHYVGVSGEADENFAALPDVKKTVWRALEHVKDAVRAMTPLSCFCGIDTQYSNGVSVYFPWSVIFKDYNKLAFAQDAGWYDFVAAYVEKTRRPPRGGGDDTAPAIERSLFSASKFVGRKVPPEGHGPSGGTVHSMRNPPRKLSQDSVKSTCVENNEKLRQIFRALG